MSTDPLNDEGVLLFGLFSLTTHRDHHDDQARFQYETAIAAISIFFFRITVRQSNEHRIVSYLFGILLACLAYTKKSYELIGAVELFSYAASWLLLLTPAWLQKRNIFFKLASIVISAAASWLVSHLVMESMVLPPEGDPEAELGVFWKLLNRGLPIVEMRSAYFILMAFSKHAVLGRQLGHLLFVTFHIQVGMGFLGINFLCEEQGRRNMLIRMDYGGDETKSGNPSNSNHKEYSHKSMDENTKMARARRFQRSVGPFILFVAFPYMAQIIVYGNINRFSYTCLEHELHRAVRLNELFDNGSNLAAMSLAESAASPDAYASSMTSVVSKAYDLFNRKFFSLPKILMLPGVMVRQPMMMLQVFPLIFLADWIKASLVSYMTSTIEALRKDTMEIRAIRTKVESYDLKNAELLQRSGAGANAFTQKRWEELTVKIQKRETVSNLISRSKGFFSFMQRNFVFTVLIDCSLATLMAIGRIVPSEIFVFSRAIEDAVDFVLTRSRSEAELAQMGTDIDKLWELVNLWTNHNRDKILLPCNVIKPGETKKLILRNLHYTRGTAGARADHAELPPGVYALTGANGSGKSTLFRVLMSCATNDQPIELPTSINLLTPMEPILEKDDILREISCTDEDAENSDDNEAELMVQEEVECEYEIDAATGEPTKICRPGPKSVEIKDGNPHPRLSLTMPSSHVAEISQSFYWPLHAKPIEWIAHQPSGDGAEIFTRVVAEHLNALEFFQFVRPDGAKEEDYFSTEEMNEATIQKIESELIEVKDDWFGDLSGGQKSKVELVRKVFMQETCPDLLLIDETMAPLDPASKSVVMSKLKDFCQDSVIIVIYHTDVGREVGEEGAAKVECVPSNNFFDHNVHLEKGLVQIRATC